MIIDFDNKQELLSMIITLKSYVEELQKKIEEMDI